MKKLYEDNELIIIDTEDGSLNPILACYGKKTTRLEYNWHPNNIEYLNSIGEKIYNTIHKYAIEQYANEKFICLDCETTGLNPNEDEILSLSIVNQDGEVLFNELIKPLNHTSWESAEAVHGIKPSDVEDKPTINKYLNDIKMILSQYHIIVGYNVSFDLVFVKKAFNVKFFSDIFETETKHSTRDVMRMFSSLKNIKWQKLEDCARYYDYKFNAHNSLEDVKATIYCYNKIMKENLGME